MVPEMIRTEKETFHTFDDGKDFNINTFVTRRPAEKWMVITNEQFNDFHSLFDKNIESIHPGLAKGNYLAELAEIHKDERAILPKNKSYFLFYNKENETEIAAVVKPFHMRTSEIELVYNECASLDLIMDFINFIVEYIIEERAECNHLMTSIRECDIERKKIFEFSGFRWCGVLHDNSIDNKNILLYESMPCETMPL